MSAGPCTVLPMDLYNADRIAHQLVSHHLPGQGWRIAWDNARGRNGQCRYGTKTLSFSRPVTQQRDEADFRNTVLHEIAHAMTPGAKHGPVWRRQFIALGGDGKRCSSDQIDQAAVAKYALECAVTREVLGYVNRKGKRLATAQCRCHSKQALWVTLR
jgi:predicted SprT family Zn-dependent metalloprotease